MPNVHNGGTRISVGTGKPNRVVWACDFYTTIPDNGGRVIRSGIWRSPRASLPPALRRIGRVTALPCRALDQLLLPSTREQVNHPVVSLVASVLEDRHITPLDLQYTGERLSERIGVSHRKLVPQGIKIYPREPLCQVRCRASSQRFKQARIEAWHEVAEVRRRSLTCRRPSDLVRPRATDALNEAGVGVHRVE